MPSTETASTSATSANSKMKGSSSKSSSNTNLNSVSTGASGTPGHNPNTSTSNNNSASNTNQDYRVVVFGSAGVGKTSLVLRFVRGKFSDTYVPTIEDTYRQVISCNKQVCTLQITDTTGIRSACWR